MSHAHTIVFSTLNDLKPGGKLNARKAPTSEADDAALMNSIASYGLLLPLICTKAREVIAGGRRLAALKALRKQKVEVPRLDYDEIPCIVLAESVDPLTVSMIENVQRAAMHPVDRFEVFSAQVAGGATVEDIAKTEGLKIAQVRQALALAGMAKEVRAAWRDGKISAEVAEAFTITTDHKAQAAALKKINKHANSWYVRRALTGDDNDGRLISFVGKVAYEKAGGEINQTLFDGDNNQLQISDYALLRRLADEKIADKCAVALRNGWKWASAEADMPKDWKSWRVISVDGRTTSKEVAATVGVVFSIDYEGKLSATYGVVKPGDKVATPKAPKTAKEKKAVAKAKEEKREETGGISGALAMRLGEQLTITMRNAIANGIGHDDTVSLAIALLACHSDYSTLEIGELRYDEKDPREGNDFSKYLALAKSKTSFERSQMLAAWISGAISIQAVSGGELARVLRPDKKDKNADRSAVEIALLADNDDAWERAALEAFDAEDYFGSISTEMIMEALEEMQSHETTGVKGAKKADLVALAVKIAKSAKWVPMCLRRPT